MTEKNKSDNTFRRCNDDAGTFCPLMCSSCELFINEDLSADENYSCITCAVGFIFDVAGNCTEDTDLVESSKANCERFSAQVADTCVQCLRGFALDDNGLCAQINIGLGCSHGDANSHCACSTGFLPVDTEKTVHRAILPQNLTPDLYNPATGCQVDTGSWNKCSIKDSTGTLCLYCQLGHYLDKNDGLCKTISSFIAAGSGTYNTWVGTTGAQGNGYHCLHASFDTLWTCVVPLAGYLVNEFGTVVTKDLAFAHVTYCLKEHVTYTAGVGTPKCHECASGYVANAVGDTCRVLKTATTDDDTVDIQIVNADKKLVGCRVEENSKCVECKEGFYQGNLKHNDHCMADGMFHCHSFYTGDNTKCNCNYDSVQNNKNDNNECQNVAKDVIVENRVWKDAVSLNNYNTTDLCYKIKAVRMFMCDSHPVNFTGPSEIGLDVISDAYLVIHENDTALQSNADFITFTRMVNEQYPKIRAAWKSTGVNDTIGEASNFCTLSA